jgi:hypothetical protein
LGIADDNDIEKLKKRFKVKNEDEEEIEDHLLTQSNIGKKKSKRKLAQE